MASASRQFVIAATPREIMDVMTDVEALPEWSAVHQSAVVLERDGRDRPLRSRSTMSAAGVSDEQVLEYLYSESGFGWRLVSSHYLKRQDATYRLTAEGQSTRLTVQLDVESAVPIPQFIMKLIVRAMIETVTSGLKNRVQMMKERSRPGAE